MSTAPNTGFQSPQKGGLGGRIFLFLFGLPFFGAGLFILWIGALGPFIKVVGSFGWDEAECRIISSRVTGDGETYQISITYQYRYAEGIYTEDRYNFIGMSSSGRKGKQKVVDRYPPGSTAICYVNPKNPEEAILSRSLGWLPVFITLFSLIFIAVGAALMFGVFSKTSSGKQNRAGFRGKRRRKKVAYGVKNGMPDANPDPLDLSPEVGRVTQLVGSLFFAAFWNGIVSVFLFQVIKGFARGHPEWFLTLFLIPFVLVGIGLVFLVLYSFLALFNPKVRLTLTPGTPRLGEPCEVTWFMEGNTGRLDSLKIVLEAEEIATYRRGTDTTTDRNIFEQVILVDQDKTSLRTTGQQTFSLPVDTMHSYKASNNEIQWTFKIHSNIHRWPDISGVFPISVLPPHR